MIHSYFRKLSLYHLRQANGEEWQYGDRRQELVFIGQGLNHSFIQSRLDQCLLTDAEMVLGPEQWKETFEDPIQMQGPEEGGEEEDGDDDEGEGEEDEEEEASTSSKTSAASPKRQKTE